MNLFNGLFENFSNSNSSVPLHIWNCIKPHFDLLEKDLYFTGKIGYILGKETGLPVKLPNVNDIVLHPNDDTFFSDEIPKKLCEEILFKILINARNLWKVSSKDSHYVEFHFTNGVVLIQECTEPEFQDEESAIKRYSITSLFKSSKLIKPTSLSNFYILSSSHSLSISMSLGYLDEFPIESLNTISELELSHCLYKKVSSWLFSSNKDNATLSYWTLVLLSSINLNKLDNTEDILHSDIKFSVNPVNPNNSMRLVINQVKSNVKYENSAYNKVDCNLHNIIALYSNLKVIQSLLPDDILSDFSEVPYYYPMLFGDMTSKIRQHYNAKLNIPAHQSKIQALRRLNNQMKKCLLEKYLEPYTVVLDLACGHGQDLMKFIDCRITEYVGIDISQSEIQEAVSRYSQKKKSDFYNYYFYVGDISDDKTFEKLEDKIFDFITCQLAIHYCLPHEEGAHKILRRVSKFLKPNGYFVGTTTCCNKIVDSLYHKLRNTQGNNELLNNSCDEDDFSLSFGNNLFNISFNNHSFEKHIELKELIQRINKSGHLSEDALVLKLKKILGTVWGISYNFWLIDHIDAVEYVVPWLSFCEIAKSYNLHLVEGSNSLEFLAKEIENNTRLREWLNDVLEKIPRSDQEVEVLSFYKVFVFIKCDSNP